VPVSRQAGGGRIADRPYPTQDKRLPFGEAGIGALRLRPGHDNTVLLLLLNGGFLMVVMRVME